MYCATKSQNALKGPRPPGIASPVYLPRNPIFATSEVANLLRPGVVLWDRRRAPTLNLEAPDCCTHERLVLRGSQLASQPVLHAPFVAGSIVSTKHGNVNTDHILFICSGECGYLFGKTIDTFHKLALYVAASTPLSKISCVSIHCDSLKQ